METALKVDSANDSGDQGRFMWWRLASIPVESNLFTLEGHPGTPTPVQLHS